MLHLELIFISLFTLFFLGGEGTGVNVDFQGLAISWYCWGKKTKIMATDKMIYPNELMNRIVNEKKSQ